MLILLLVLAVSPLSAKELGPFNITLRYAPQESTGSSVPTLMMGISDRPVKVSISDGRTISDPAVIGDSTDDDDRVWPIRAASDVVAWSNEVLLKNAGEWGVRVAEDAPTLGWARATPWQQQPLRPRRVSRPTRC